jgi:glutathione peroxidase-family protein
LNLLSKNANTKDNNGTCGTDFELDSYLERLAAVSHTSTNGWMARHFMGLYRWMTAYQCSQGNKKSNVSCFPCNQFHVILVSNTKDMISISHKSS